MYKLAFILCLVLAVSAKTSHSRGAIVRDVVLERLLRNSAKSMDFKFNMNLQSQPIKVVIRQPSGQANTTVRTNMTNNSSGFRPNPPPLAGVRVNTSANNGFRPQPQPQGGVRINTTANNSFRPQPQPQGGVRVNTSSNLGTSRVNIPNIPTSVASQGLDLAFTPCANNPAINAKYRISQRTIIASVFGLFQVRPAFGISSKLQISGSFTLPNNDRIVNVDIYQYYGNQLSQQYSATGTNYRTVGNGRFFEFDILMFKGPKEMKTTHDTFVRTKGPYRNEFIFRSDKGESVGCATAYITL